MNPFSLNKFGVIDNFLMKKPMIGKIPLKIQSTATPDGLVFHWHKAGYSTRYNPMLQRWEKVYYLDCQPDESSETKSLDHLTVSQLCVMANHPHLINF